MLSTCSTVIVPPPALVTDRLGRLTVTGSPRYGAVDVQYLDDGGARAALVVSEDASFATLVEEYTRPFEWQVRISSQADRVFISAPLPDGELRLDQAPLLIDPPYVDLQEPRPYGAQEWQLIRHE